MTVISQFYFSPETEVWEKVSARKLLKYDCMEHFFHENSIYPEPVKKLPLNLWDLRVYYRVYKILPLVHILSKIDSNP